MKKYQLFAVISFVCICLSILYSVVGFSQTSQSQVLLSTNPPLEKILPFEAGTEKKQSPVNFTFKAVDSAGKLLTNALIKLEISTPPRNLLLTTDFPMVEGTKLLEMEAIAPNGKLEFQQMLPIRGNYKIQVNVSPTVANSFTSYQQTLNLNVRENPIKYKYFAVVAAILLSLGLLGGWVIGGQEELREGEIAPQSVRLLLSALTVVAIVTLLFINITAETAEAHGGHFEINEKIAPSITQSEGVQMKILGDDLAIVGKLANLSVEVKDNATGEPIKDVGLKVKAIALEDNLTVFSYEGISNQEGKLKWQEQFFDGSPHKVEVEAFSLAESQRQFPSVKVARKIEVEGVAPPMYIRLIGLFYFTAIVGIGMMIGLVLQELRKREVRLS